MTIDCRFSNEVINKAGRSYGIEEVEPVDFKLNFSGQGNIHYQERNILNLDEITDDDENSLDVHKCASNKTA